MKRKRKEEKKRKRKMIGNVMFFLVKWFLCFFIEKLFGLQF